MTVSVEVCPGIRSIETAHASRPDLAWLKITNIDTKLAIWLRLQWFPMRDAPAVPTSNRPYCFVAPNIFARILRMANDFNLAELILRPKSTVTSTDRAIAIDDYFGRARNFNSNGTAMTSSRKHDR